VVGFSWGISAAASNAARGVAAALVLADGVADGLGGVVAVGEDVGVAAGVVSVGSVGSVVLALVAGSLSSSRVIAHPATPPVRTTAAAAVTPMVVRIRVVDMPPA
jgi:hypothetical protein